jgi:Mn2+/Fe2+ NRAMP family transporter
MRRRWVGPGLLLAATSIGGSHLLLAPEVGARFGYSLLWLVWVAHLLKYAAFDAGPRYAAATGESLLEGYARVPGPRGWALWLGLVDMVVESVGVLAAVIALTASFLLGATGVGSLRGWGMAVGLLSVALVWSGGYSRLTRVALVVMVALVGGTLLAFVAAIPDLGAVAKGALPGPIPRAGWVLAASVLGWMPTGVGVSVWHSLWLQRTMELEGAAGGEGEPSAAWVRWARGDLLRGYGLSLLLGLVFAALGAAVLRPAGVVLAERVDVALALASLYAHAHRWLGPLFLLVAFAAMFSTCHAAMDGFPRTLVATLDLLRGRPRCRHPEERKLYRAYLLAATFGGLALLGAVPDPMRLVQILGAVTLVVTPVYAALNHYCVCHLPVAEGGSMQGRGDAGEGARAGVVGRPGLLWRLLSWAGILFLTGCAIWVPPLLLGLWSPGTAG